MLTSLITFLKKDGQGEDKEKYRPYRKSTGPTGRGWPGSYPRLSVAKEHRKIVTSIIKQEEQLAGFNQLLEMAARSTGQLEGFTGGPSKAQEVWQNLQPSLVRMSSSI